MEIEITYRTWDSGRIVGLTIGPESYFDPLETDETYERDGIPKHNETWMYWAYPGAV
jgi:hypothetical protein